MKKYLISILLAGSLTAFLCGSSLFAQEEEKKTLTAEEAAEAAKKLEELRATLKREIKKLPEVQNAGSITGKVSCKRMRTNADAIVYIEKGVDNDFEPPSEHGVVDQMNLTYVPHVLAIQKGATVDFPNSDAVRHNVFSPPTSAFQFNLGTYPTGVTKEVPIEVTGEIPLLCNVHAEMAGYIVSFSHPYFGVTDKEGNYTIEGVPPGKYTLNVWHERLRGVSKEVTVEPGKVATVDFELKRRR